MTIYLNCIRKKPTYIITCQINQVDFCESILVKSKKSFICKSIIIAVAAFYKFIDYRIEAVRRLNVNYFSSYQCMKFRAVWYYPEGIITHFQNVIDQDCRQAFLFRIICKSGAIINAQSTKSGKIKHSSTVLKHESYTIVNQSIFGCVIDKG